LDIRPWLAGGLDWMIADGQSGRRRGRCTRIGQVAAWSVPGGRRGVLLQASLHQLGSGGDAVM